MDVVIVLVLAGLAAWWLFRDSSQSSTPARTHEEPAVVIDGDAYERIKTVAQLYHGWKKGTGWDYQNDSVDIHWQKENDSQSLYMQCVGDCIGIHAQRTPHHGLVIDTDNIVTYQASGIEGYSNYDGDDLFDGFRRGCPDAMLERVSKESNGIWVHIKFR